MFDPPSRLPGANERRRRGFPRLHHAIGLNQKQLALSKLEKWLATLRIGASAEHFLGEHFSR
jgi:hypothetical protein